MATICAEITEDQDRNCLTPLVDGNESTLYLANRKDIAGYVRDDVNQNIIRSIIMKPGKRFFMYEGARSTLKPRFTTVRKPLGITKYKHDLDAVIFNWSSAIKVEIEQLAQGEFVAIVVNNDKSSDAAIEVYGVDRGLIMKDGAIRDLNSTDYGAAFPFGLENAENEEESHTPASFAVLNSATPPVYSYTASITALTALTVPAA